MRKHIKQFFEENWTNWTLRDKIMVAVIAALAGLALGSFLAPARKKGFGNTTHNTFESEKPVKKVES